MTVFAHSRSFVRDYCLLLLGLCLSFYFLYHALAGPRSFFRLVELQMDVVQLAGDLEEMRAQHASLEKKVVMLRPETLDLDYVEELAVSTLGYQKPSDVVVLVSGKQ